MGEGVAVWPVLETRGAKGSLCGEPSGWTQRNLLLRRMSLGAPPWTLQLEAFLWVSGPEAAWPGGTQVCIRPRRPQEMGRGVHG